MPTEGPPDTIAGWRAHAEGLLTRPACAFHRNMEISSHYAGLHRRLPTCFKWAGMAAIASHHVRLVLFPLRLDADRAVLPRGRSLRRSLLIEDVHTIRATNDAIFDDIFWVHLAYLDDDGGIERLRSLLRGEDRYAPVLAGFEAIDRGRRVLEDATASAAERRAAEDLVWEGNVRLLEHEQRALVQPRFDQLSCAFARLVSIGAATAFEVRGMRYEVAYFTSFYLHSLTWGMPHVLRAREWPRLTRYEDRWNWITGSVVPRFRRFDAVPRLVGDSLRRIVADARDHASAPCVPIGDR